MNGFGTHKSSQGTIYRNNGSIAESESELSTLYKKYEQFQLYDQDRSKFMSVWQFTDLHQQLPCLTN
jgi:hypothetical protein